MKKNLIKFCLLALVAAIALPLFACTDNGGNETTAGETTASTESTSEVTTEETEDTTDHVTVETQSTEITTEEVTTEETTEENTCEHGEYYGERHYGDDGCYNYYCAECHHVLYSHSVSDDVELFVSPTEIKGKYPQLTKDNGGVNLVTDKGEWYVRIKGGARNEQKSNIVDVYTDGKVVTGKYMVMKYRIMKNNNRQTSFIFYAGTVEPHISSSKEYAEFAVSEDAKWHIAVIDLSLLVGNENGSNIVADENGNYTVKFIQLRPMTSGTNVGSIISYTDVAYIALCDDLADVAGVVSDSDCDLYTSRTSYTTLNSSELKSDSGEESSAPVTETTEDESDNNVTEEETVDIIYDRYDLDSYVDPIWDGGIVRNETVMFVGANDKRQLLYPADEIISVRSYDLSIEYVRGVDYDYVDGYLVLLEGTSIKYITEDVYYTVRNPDQDWLKTMYNGVATSTYWGEGEIMTQWQLAVTYKHSQTWEGHEVECHADRYAEFIGKLERGEDVTVFFYGDSITTGANSSQGKPPYAHMWPRMFVQYAAEHYKYSIHYVDARAEIDVTNINTVHTDESYGNRGTITYINTAVGGWSTNQGLTNVEQYVNKLVRKYGCDLFVLAYGMNDSGSKPENYIDMIEDIVIRVNAWAPEANVVLVSTMSPNPDAVGGWYGNQVKFEPLMIELADKLNDGGTPCSVATVTSMSQSVLERKSFRDYTGNNINHPNDFFARIYAQVLIETVFGYDNLENVSY